MCGRPVIDRPDSEAERHERPSWPDRWRVRTLARRAARQGPEPADRRRGIPPGALRAVARGLGDASGRRQGGRGPYDGPADRPGGRAASDAEGRHGVPALAADAQQGDGSVPGSPADARVTKAQDLRMDTRGVRPEP
eukprot:TRINITY_DN41654_c0_g1_i1.p2 TRINITY_DN41654_c0_g1~~TRINITY_DN41654_c0_g1_i1.p2  ORF type:complete len:137 (-),score=23.42 TRINITY_DN41654_c0_g1_i1:193-603(-)